MIGKEIVRHGTLHIGAFVQFERQSYEQQGVGLGLKIVKKIVELAGGDFSITSIYQQQTTIHISLPLIYI